MGGGAAACETGSGGGADGTDLEEAGAGDDPRRGNTGGTDSLACFDAVVDWGARGGTAIGGTVIGGTSVFCRHHGQRTVVPARLW